MMESYRMMTSSPSRVFAVWSREAQGGVGPSTRSIPRRMDFRQQGKVFRLTVVRYESYSAWISSGVLVGGDCLRRDEETKDLVTAEGSELDGLDEAVRATERAMERANMMGIWVEMGWW